MDLRVSDGLGGFIQAMAQLYAYHCTNCPPTSLQCPHQANSRGDSIPALENVNSGSRPSESMSHGDIDHQI